jgi:hypothetical protein
MTDENITLVLGAITTVLSQSVFAQEELIEDMHATTFLEMLS